MPDEHMFERSFELAPNFPLPIGQLELKGGFCDILPQDNISGKH
jgi:hypothetical protein